VKIAFITSCLEPGKDGVGDYTTLLAGECARRGHATRLVALNDPHLDCPEAGAGSLRLASKSPWKERVESAGEFLRAFAPDFVSLQFVCYGFHARGTDPALASRFRAIIGAAPVQIMFHELWIGAGKGARLKDRLTGAIQRACLLRVVGVLNTRVVHANTAAYAALLRARGVAASTLPLFGSIPMPSPDTKARVRGDKLVFGMFGTLHPIWPPEPLFSTLLTPGKKIEVVHIGRMGTPGEALWEKLTEDYAGVIEFRKAGELPPEKIAEVFRSEIDYGIATTPWELIGKSAAAAAMLEHGLPVIVNRDDWEIDAPVETGAHPPLLIKMDRELPQKLDAARREEPVSFLPGVATRFLGDLERAL